MLTLGLEILVAFDKCLLAGLQRFEVATSSTSLYPLFLASGLWYC